ncbi:hypothetical protein SAMN02927930_01998 [Pseudidiomarina indica]|uniref:Uncharacterized protein n=1 Tax=Pseudidiomarina indica TaxID=1159017 RepID=A0A1G6E0M0_9GAMM|nr:hypothetical protein [Pseudidiomarina indica]SDB50987.1 hypothetical protein SAMN02927930_01998 [Pseudidiomarina indica]
MPTKQRGMFAPMVVLFAAMLAMLALPHQDASIGQLQRLRYQHETWWFWQQAVATLHRDTGTWPASLTEVAQHFQLGEVPQFIVGILHDDRFDLEWIGLSASDLELLQELDTTAVVNIDGHIVRNKPGESGAEVTMSYLPRSGEATMLTALSLAGHQLRVNHLNAELVNVTDSAKMAQVTVDEAQIQRVQYHRVLTVTSFHSAPMLLDELLSLKSQIDALREKLLEHMKPEPGQPSPYRHSSCDSCT